MSSTCDRFIFDICSANPSICKNCKINKAQHNQTAPIQKDSKLNIVLKPNILKQNIPPPIVEHKIEATKESEIVRESTGTNLIDNSIDKKNVINQTTTVASAKPAELIKAIVSERIEPDQKQINPPTSIQPKISSVAQMIKDREEKLKQQQSSNINSYSSTPRRDTVNSIVSQLKRPSFASASQSQNSIDTPSSQTSQSQSSTFSAIAQILKDQSSISNTPKEPEITSNNNSEKDKDQTVIMTDQLTKELQEKEAQQLTKKQDEEKERQKQLEQERKLEIKQREERQRVEQEIQAKQLKQQNDTIKEEQPKAKVNSTKGLTFAEILARQKEKADSTASAETTKPATTPHAYQSLQQPRNVLPQYQSIQQSQLQQSVKAQVPLKAQENTFTKTQEKEQPPIIQPPLLIKKEEPQVIQTIIKSPQPISQIDNKKEIQTPTIAQDQKVNTTFTTEVNQQKEEQKPLGLVALRKLELQNKLKQAQSPPQPASITPKTVKPEGNLQSKMDFLKKEEQKVVTPTQIQKQVAMPQRIESPKKEEIKKEEGHQQPISQNKLEIDQNKEIKKPSLISQLKSQLGNQIIGFGLPNPPPPVIATQVKVDFEEQQKTGDSQNNKFENIPFLKEEQSLERDSQRVSYQDALDRPVMKRNVRASHKAIFKGDEDD